MVKPYIVKYKDTSINNWRQRLESAIYEMLHTEEIISCIDKEHIQETPLRFIKALDEYFSGILEDPKELLHKAMFKARKPHGMIHVGGQQFYSTCAHHLAPFFGVMHFAYIPSDSNDNLIGLSKIPRLMEGYARRPQVQEQLTANIVDAFQEVVRPAGCALLVRASHFCMEARGVKAHGTETTTTQLRGVFIEQKVKEEFLMAANRLEWRV